jgi:hypothetical protein
MSFSHCVLSTKPTIFKIIFDTVSFAKILVKFGKNILPLTLLHNVGPHFNRNVYMYVNATIILCRQVSTGTCMGNIFLRLLAPANVNTSAVDHHLLPLTLMEIHQNPRSRSNVAVSIPRWQGRKLFR